MPGTQVPICVRSILHLHSWDKFPQNTRPFSSQAWKQVGKPVGKGRLDRFHLIREQERDGFLRRLVFVPTTPKVSVSEEDDLILPGLCAPPPQLLPLPLSGIWTRTQPFLLPKEKIGASYRVFPQHQARGPGV